MMRNRYEDPAITQTERTGYADPMSAHAPEATYVICSECGRKIWDDEEDEWLEGVRFHFSLCVDCMDKCRRPLR